MSEVRKRIFPSLSLSLYKDEFNNESCRPNRLLPSQPCPFLKNSKLSSSWGGIEEVESLSPGSLPWTRSNELLSKSLPRSGNRGLLQPGRAELVSKAGEVGSGLETCEAPGGGGGTERSLNQAGKPHRSRRRARLAGEGRGGQSALSQLRGLPFSLASSRERSGRCAWK